MSRSLVISGAIELQLDALAERIAQRVVELLTADAVAGAVDQGVLRENSSDVYGRGEPDGPRTPDTDPGGFHVGRDHPYNPDHPEELT